METKSSLFEQILRYPLMLIIYLLSWFHICTGARPRIEHASVSPNLIPSYKKNWIDSKGEILEPPQSSTSFKVITYNVLGPLHGESTKHNYAPVSVTKWTRRRDKLLEEIRAMQADIICLQEVTQKGLKESFIPGLLRVGLDCAGFAPTQQHTLKGKSAHKNIGTAVFYKPEIFERIASKRIHLADFAPLANCRSHQFHKDVTSKKHSMVMVLLKLKDSQQFLIVASTHLFWDPRREDIKTIQVCAATHAITQFSLDCGFKKENFPPLIFCGDYNIMQYSYNTELSGRKSAMFELLKQGKLEKNHPEHPDTWFENMENDGFNPFLGVLKSSLILNNPYEMEEFSNFAPFFTTKTDQFQGWIDHIWVNEKVKVKMVLEPPVKKIEDDITNKIKEFKPIPNKEYPSDHIPIGIVAEIL